MMKTIPDANAPSNDGLPEISVEILGPVASLKGHSWPRGRDRVRNEENVPLAMTAAREPHQLIIRLPGGRTLRNISKGTIFHQHKGIIEDAQLLPHPGELDFQDAIRLLELILQEWDAQLTSEAMTAIDKWKTEGSIAPYAWAERRGWASIRGEDRAHVYFDVRGGKGGWLLWIMVGATREERGRLHGTLPAEPTTTRPK